MLPMISHILCSLFSCSEYYPPWLFEMQGISASYGHLIKRKEFFLANILASRCQQFYWTSHSSTLDPFQTFSHKTTITSHHIQRNFCVKFACKWVSWTSKAWIKSSSWKLWFLAGGGRIRWTWSQLYPSPDASNRSKEASHTQRWPIRTYLVYTRLPHPFLKIPFTEWPSHHIQRKCL